MCSRYSGVEVWRWQEGREARQGTCESFALDKNKGAERHATARLSLSPVER
jgi:hypothetical protein